MYLFEHIVRSHDLEYDNSDLIYLKSFASRSLQGIAYELSMMEATLVKNYKFNPKPIGSVIVYDNFETQDKIKITDKEFNIPFLFKVSNQDKILDDEVHNKQVYILSFFKSLALFIELVKIYEDKNIDQEEKNNSILALVEKFRVNIPIIEDDKAIQMKKDYFEKIMSKYACSPEGKRNCSENNEFDILNIKFKSSSFGILEIATFSKRLVDFFMNVRDNITEKSLITFNSDKFKYHENKKEFDFHLPIITYFTSFTQALFISLFHSIRKDNVLSIKSKHKNSDEIIFKKKLTLWNKRQPYKNGSSISGKYM